MPDSHFSPVRASARLHDVHYEIRGELTRRALELEAAGREIVKLNIGNPGLFGFEVPAHVREALTQKLIREIFGVDVFRLRHPTEDRELTVFDVPNRAAPPS